MTPQSDTELRCRFDVELSNGGLWYATSPDVKGLLVAEHMLQDCLSEIVPTLAKMALARQLAGKEDCEDTEAYKQGYKEGQLMTSKNWHQNDTAK
jgi:hypothetical protein